MFSNGKWGRAQDTARPKVNLCVALYKKGTKFVNVERIADTGAQSTIWSLGQFLIAGFAMSDLSCAALSLNAANKLPIRIDGISFDNRTETSSTKSAPSCRSMVYISRDVKDCTFYTNRCCN